MLNGALPFFKPQNFFRRTFFARSILQLYRRFESREKESTIIFNQVAGSINLSKEKSLKNVSLWDLEIHVEQINNAEFNSARNAAACR